MTRPQRRATFRIITRTVVSLTTALTAATAATGQDGDAAVERFRERHPAARALFEDGRLVRLYGAAMAYGATPRDAAEGFVAANGDVLGVAPEDLVLMGVQPIWAEDGGSHRFTAVHYGQASGGIPVYSAGLTLLVRHDAGNAVVLASCHLFDLAASAAAPPPARDSRDALAEVRGRFPDLVFEPPELVIDPRGGEPVHAYRLRGRDERPGAGDARELLVDATTGRVIHDVSLVYRNAVEGVVEGMSIPLGDPFQEPVAVPLSDLRVRIDGGRARITDEAGAFAIPHEGEERVRVVARLAASAGRWIRVVSHTGPRFLTEAKRVRPPGPVELLFNPEPSELTTSQVDCYHYATRAHNFATSVLPDYPNIGDQIVCNVNLPRPCDAFYDGAVNFAHAGNGCPNAAYSTVIFHEYGHHLVGRAYNAVGRRQPRPPYHEGMADLTAHLGLETSCLFPGFFSPACTRSSVNDRTYPCTDTSEHVCGQVLSGAFWDLLTALERTSEPGLAMAHVRRLWLGSILLLPQDITPALATDVLTLDDDDDELANGTPHFPEITEAFGRHGLAVGITPANAIPCGDVRGLATACTAAHRLNARLLLTDAGHDGESVLMTIDGEPFEVEVTGNKAFLSDCCWDPGAHVVTVRRPIGCVEPATLECPP